MILDNSFIVAKSLLDIGFDIKTQNSINMIKFGILSNQTVLTLPLHRISRKIFAVFYKL